MANNVLDESWYAAQNKSIEENLNNVAKIARVCNSTSWQQIVQLQDQLSDALIEKKGFEDQLKEVLSKKDEQEQKFNDLVQQMNVEKNELKETIKRLEDEIANNAKMDIPCGECGRSVARFCSIQCYEVDVK